jgi:thioredoxin reductase (NADPH)
MEYKIHHTIIIGSGPAGYTAAIYAARANMHPVLFTGTEPGGQLMITTEVENYRFNTVVKFETITKVDFSSPVHKIWTESGEEFHAHSIIISTGASAKWLGLESEKRMMNKGVSACAVCDGFFFKGLPVGVVGAGDTAAEEASYLAKLCPEVHLVVRRDEMRASKIMQERVMNNPKIKIHWNTETKEILGTDEVEGVEVINNKSGEISTIPLKGYFIAIGHKPNSGPFQGILEMDDQGYIKTIPGTSKTNVEGIFACGDVQDRIYRQAVTAAGTGCMAALDAERYLVSKGIL